MDADLFLQQFGHLTQGEGGIKKLRDVILQLAVRGKLVEQNSADEPAEVLLKRVKPISSRTRTELKMPNVKDLEKPFLLPRGWSWTLFGQIFDFQGGGQPPKTKFIYEPKTDYIRLIQIRDLGEKPAPVYVPASSISKTCKEGDILVGRYGASVGKVFWGISGAYNVALCKMIFDEKSLYNRFIFTFLNSDLFQKPIKSYSRSAQDGFNKGDVFPILVPLPPLAEQKRIVAKVDELMALCDKLEAEQKAQRTLKTQAVQSTLHHLTSAESPASFGTSLNILERTFGNWFDDLATVKHLRATILQLAVQGKLVPQNPTDEPASELLKRIETEKKRLVKEGKIKRPPTVAPIDDKDSPLILPAGWSWARMGEVYDVRDGTHDSPKYQTEGYPLVTSKDFVNGRISFDKCKLISKEDHEKIAQRSKVDNGDILFSMIGGNIGNMVLVDTDREFSIKNVALFKYYSLDFSMPDFLRIVLKNLSENVQHQAIGGAQPFVSLGFLRGAQIGLPPLAEQKRIVAKVDELMTLCDQLEAHITQTQTLNTHLMDSLIHRMTAAA